MTYDDLMKSILTAQDEMLRCGIEANSVTLNGRKYGKLIENLPPNMKPTIFGMAVKADYTLPDDYDFLAQYEPPQPQTNSDRIRMMTDEELARFIFIGCDGRKCIETDESESIPHQCERCWLDWLKQEVIE